MRWRAALIGGAILLACGCAAPLALMPVTPLLSAMLSTRGGDYENTKRIEELQRKGDWAGLARLAQAMVAANANNEDALILLGYAQLQLRDIPGATETLTRATRISPEEIDAWNLLGEAQRLSSRPDAAIRTLVHATSVDPSSPASLFLLGEAYQDAGSVERALVAYNAAVELEPGMSPAWFSMGLLLKRSGRREEAAKAVQVLQKLDPALAAKLAAEK